MKSKDEYAKKMLNVVAEFFDRYPESYEMPILTKEHHIIVKIERYEWE